jgi:hypothetical protein
MSSKFFRPDDREEEVSDQSQGNGSDNKICHLMGFPPSNTLARTHEDQHERKEAESGSDVSNVRHEGCHILLSPS